jgi:hypothetical protein
MQTIALYVLLNIGAMRGYGPYARPAFGATHATASAHSRALLAWSEKDAKTGRARIQVTILDTSGRTAVARHALPVIDEGADALMPAAGSNGDTFLVVWAERYFGTQQTVAVALDRYGAPLGEPQYLVLETATPDFEPARVHWLGDAYGVYTPAKRSVRVSADGVLLGPIGSTGAVPVAEAVRSEAQGHFSYRVKWWAGSKQGEDEMPVDVDTGAPFMTPAGDRWLVVWSSLGRIHYRFTDESQKREAAMDADAHSRPRAACGPKICLIVFATRSSNIDGLAVDHTAPDLIAMPFTPVASMAMEREPEITMMTSSRALFTWRSAGADGEQIMRRPLSIPAGAKQRAVR